MCLLDYNNLGLVKNTSTANKSELSDDARVINVIWLYTYTQYVSE